jgi:hypothetical protein
LTGTDRNQHKQAAQPRADKARSFRLGHVPGAIERGADCERDAQPGPQRADQANREGHAAACERPGVSTDLRSDHGHSFQRRVQELVLKGGIALEHEPEDRREYEHQRED